jgi:nucleoid DNA-binding protein
MTKNEFIARLAKRMNCSLKEAEQNLTHCVEEFKQIWIEGEELTIPGFGKFFIRGQAARTARNPKTGHSLAIDAKQVPLFKPGDAIKLHINNAHKANHKQTEKVS